MLFWVTIVDVSFVMPTQPSDTNMLGKLPAEEYLLRCFGNQLPEHRVFTNYAEIVGGTTYLFVQDTCGHL